MAARRPPQVPSPVVPMPDPPIEMGSFRALPRITGGFVICDERRPPFERAVRFCTTEGAARAAVSELGADEWLETHRTATTEPKNR